MLALIFATTIAGSVPFSLQDHRIFVSATIGNAGPFAMIVDTGSSGLVVTPDVARRIGLAGKPAGYMTGAGSGRVAATAVTVRGLRLGSVRFDAAQAFVGDLSAIRKAIGFKRLDGVIGYDQFKNLRMLVDADRRRLTFSSAPLTVPATAAVTPFTVDGGLPFVAAAVDGVHGTFLVDTGDRSQLTLFKPFAQANDFFAFATVRNALTGQGVGGPLYADLLRTTLQAFNTTSTGVPTRLPVASKGAFASADYAGSIGYGFLERFNVVFDYPDRRIVSWSAQHAPADTSLFHVTEIPPAPADRLVRHALFGAAAMQKPGGVTLTFVPQGGAAYVAGLRTGDVLQQMGERAIVTTADYYTAVHDARAGTPIDVTFVRKSVSQHATITLGTASNEADPTVKTIYQSVDVDDSLRRTIVTVPQSASGKLPAVLIIGGIGCFSVDVASNPNDAYLHVAHDLSRAGFAVMRLEKSGIGDSQGPPCAKVDFEAERRGYEAALQSLASNELVDPKRVYLFGHSIGSVIAPQLATTNRVAGIIVAEAVGRDWPEYEIRNLRRQLELGGETPANVDRLLLEKTRCMQMLLFENQPEATIESTMPQCGAHNGVYPVDPWYVRQVARLNVIEPWTRVNVPVLAIYGTADVVTERADHERIVDIVNAGHSGFASFVAIDNMSHLLAVAASAKDAAAADTNGTPQTYDQELSKTIIEWLSHS
ncbi:MAG TPA: alpha/beta fold hydrolase [Candidatus Baltobacteraceae bacterium]|jgi:hypothetical protein